MNIFVLDEDPAIAAAMACDQHVVKMVTETAQLLSTACRLHGVNVGYKPTHQNHPCSMWARESWGNFGWLLMHGLALSGEYTYRYGKTHAAGSVLSEIMEAVTYRDFEAKEQTPFAQCMPVQYRGTDAVQAYRAFYLGEKARFARWRKSRPAPDWFVAGQVAEVRV